MSNNADRLAEIRRRQEEQRRLKEIQDKQKQEEMRQLNNKIKKLSDEEKEAISNQVQKQNMQLKAYNADNVSKDLGVSKEEAEKLMKQASEKGYSMSDLSRDIKYSNWGETPQGKLARGTIDTINNAGTVLDSAIRGADSGGADFLSYATRLTKKKDELLDNMGTWGKVIGVATGDTEYLFNKDSNRDEETKGIIDSLGKFKADNNEQLDYNRKVVEANSNTNVAKKLNELAPSIGNNAVGAGIGMLSPTAGTMYFIGSAGGGYYDDAVQRGMNEDQALLYGSVMGVMEGLTEKVALGQTTKAGMMLGKGELGKALTETGISLGENFIQEAIMEPIQETSAMLIGGKDKADFSNMGQRMLQSGIDGALSAILMEGATAGVQSAVNVQDKIESGQKVSEKEIQLALLDIQASKKVDIEAKFRQEVQYQVQKASREYAEKNNIPNLQQNNTINQNTNQQQQISQVENKNSLNQNVKGQSETKFSKILNNQKLPMQSYVYEKSDNLKVDSLRQQANKYFNNSPEAHNFVNMLEKIITDKNIAINFDTNMAKDVNGYYNNGVITINPNSSRAGEFLAIHELTHAIGTDSMIKMIDNYRKSNAEFDSQVQKLLQKYNKSEISEEALADIAGQLFGNQEYINNLSKTNPNMFKRIYNEIKYLWHQFRGYKNQDQFVDDLMFKWEQAYRKNSQLNDTNRKSLVGESATLADKDKLKQAQKMEQSGMTADEIFKETGWYKGNEGKWRFELDDSNWNLKDIRTINPEGNTKLENILDAPELYKAYPELKELTVQFNPNLNKNDYGRLTTDMFTGEQRIVINSKLIDKTDPKSFEMLRLKNQPEIFSTLQHEIQHYIQNKEGFSSGASPAYWFNEKNKEYKEKIYNVFGDKSNILSKYGYDNGNKVYFDLRQLVIQKSIMHNTEVELTELKDTEANQQQIKNNKGIIESRKQWLEKDMKEIQSIVNEKDMLKLNKVLQEYDEFLKKGHIEASKLYLNTAGEQESRDVESRIKLSSEEKKNTLPFIKDENTVYAKDDVDAYSQREYISDTVDESEEKVYNRYHTNTLDEKVRLRSGSLLKNNIVAYDNGNYFVIHNLDYGKYAIQDVIPVSNKAQSEYIEKFLEEVENDYANGYRKTTNEMLRLPQNRFRSSQSSNVNANEQQSWTEFADSVLDEYERINGRRFNIQDEGDKKTNNEGLEKSSSFNLPKNHKQQQLDIILKSNPMQDDYHTGIRELEDIKTLSETLQDKDWADYDEFNPDLSRKEIEEAIETGKITVYSSYPIEQGTFISPSRMEAESYSGDGKIYSKEVDINDVAWIDPTQGQYAKINENDISSLPKTDNKGNMLSKQQQEYFKDSKVRDENGKLLEVYHGTEANAGIPQEHWFTTFDLEHARPSTLGDGFYFTEDYERASSYAHSKGNVYKVYLNITNPFIKADNQTFSEAIREINPNYDIRKLYRNEHEASRFDGVKLRKYLIDNGYDGISLQGTYVAFYPEQIKNVNNQNPTLNPDIRYSKNSNTWQEYLEKEFPAKGTRTNMQDIKQGTNLPTGKNVNQNNDINLSPKVSKLENSNNSLYNMENIKERNVGNMAKKGVTVSKQYLEQKFKELTGDSISRAEAVLGGVDLRNATRKDGQVESYPYSKEALDIFDKYQDSKKSSKYLYHSTSKENIKNIIENGLTIGNKQNQEGVSSKDKLYLSATEELAQSFAPSENITFRINPNAKLENLNNDLIGGEGSYSITNNIPADMLQVKENGKWVNLNKSQIYKDNINLPTKETVSQKKSEVNLPQKVSANNQYKDTTTKVRKHYKSIIESANTTPEAKAIAKKLMGTDTYIPETNKSELERADEKIMNSTPESELNSLMSRATVGEKITPVDIAVGERLIEYYSKAGDKAKLQDAIQATAMAGTTAGQTVQAMSLLNHMTPQGQAVWLQRSVDKMNNKLKKTRGKNAQQFTLTDDMLQKIVSSENEEQLAKNLDEVYQELGQQVSKSTMEKIDAWRYFSMLANPRTHIRNIGGNVAMGKVQTGKNKVAGVIEATVAKFNPNMERTHTIVPASKEVRQFAKADIKNVTDRLGLTEGKLNPQTRLENNMKTFKHDAMNKTVGKLFDLNNKALEVEDGWGLKAGYVKALAEYMTANKLKPDTITDAQLSKARNYAVQQAKEATFHQENQLASLVNQLSNRNRFAKFGVDAVLPFKKTPMNIAKTGIEYSPVGLAKSMVLDTVQLRKGNITVNQYIDNISKGLTGTGIALVGYALAQAGILKASGGDDDKEKYEEGRGKQAFSIQIGDNTYSLDWLAPTAIPLFIGAEISALNRATNETKTSNSSDEDSKYNQLLKSTTNVLDAFTNSMNPMMEMSMLSGLASTLRSYEQGATQGITAMGTNALKSYVNQFFPTAMGQVAKTMDPYERSTTSTKSGMLPKAVDSTKNQIMAKVPGLRQMLPTKTDVWGNEMKQPENVVQRALENAVLPYTRKEVNNNDVDQELVRLYEERGEKAVLPSSSLSKDLTFSGEKYKMTSEEFAKYKKDYGSKSYSLINDLVNSSDYNRLSDEDKQQALENVYKYAKEYAKDQYAKANDIDYKKDTMFKTAQEMEKSGNVSSYFNYLAKTDGMKEKEKMNVLVKASYENNDKKLIYTNTIGSDDKLYNDAMKYTGININEYLKYKQQEFTSDKTDDGTVNGKSVSGSKKAKVYDYVNKMKITGEQRMLLLGTQYKLTNEERATLANYVKNLKITKNQKLEIYKKLQGFTVYKDGRVTY